MSASRTRRLPWLAAACRASRWAVLGAVLGAAAAWTLAGWRSADPALQESGRIARRAALAHSIYAPEVRHPVEVAAGEKAHLMAWLSKRLEADVKAPDLRCAGFVLLGGRLLPAEALSGTASLPAAQFMYENATGRRVTLYMRNARSQHGDSELDHARVGPVTVFYWIQGALAYAVASADVDQGELRSLAQAVRRPAR